MNILVIGGGGREHAIVWKLAQSSLRPTLYCAPGNPGISRLATCVPIKPTDISSLKQFAIEHHIDLTIVGPEQPLVDGIVDEFEAAGLKIFGPSKLAAQLEGSKVFAKDFMKRNSIPTASFASFSENDNALALEYLETCSFPIVIKADGLAAGKGVTICLSKQDAIQTLKACFDEKVFAKAGSSVVIEEYLEGEEASLFVLSDGENFVTMPAAQDHKRVFDNDEGKNTGGMGAYAPAPVVTENVLKQVCDSIIRPTLAGMNAEGYPYKGCLFVGLMMTKQGPKVIEYNCRFGDPETQVVLPLLDEDFADLTLQIAQGTLQKTLINVKQMSALCVVIASGGYPDSYGTGKEISGIETAEVDEHIMVFHSGTALSEDRLVTSGGRVLCVTAIGDSLQNTQSRVYATIPSITFDGMHFRRDIGNKGLRCYSSVTINDKL